MWEEFAKVIICLVVGYYALAGLKALHFFGTTKYSAFDELDNVDKQLLLPRKVFLVRHGESLGNVEDKTYVHTPDWAIPLTDKGKQEARAAGQKIKQECGDTALIVYFSPYKRTRETMKEIISCFPREQIEHIKEEPRIREQDFGNFQDYQRMKLCKKERVQFSRFFYRFPMGESGADVFDRVSSFMESLFRLFRKLRVQHSKEKGIRKEKEFDLVLVSHGLTIRIILMRWFRWTVQEFEELTNPNNASPLVMLRQSENKYVLTQHSLDLLHNPNAIDNFAAEPCDQ